MNKVKTTIGVAALVGYIATIFLANWAIQHFGIVSLGFGLYAPAGVFAVGAALLLRDVTQISLGRKAAVAAIGVGAALSYTVAPAFAVASGVAFLLSETTDFAVFTPLAKRGWNRALAASTAVGAVVDSAVFLWLAFHSEAFFKGQVVGKLSMTVLALAISALLRPSVQRKIQAAAAVA